MTDADPRADESRQVSAGRGNLELALISGFVLLAAGVGARSLGVRRDIALVIGLTAGILTRVVIQRRWHRHSVGTADRDERVRPVGGVDLDSAAPETQLGSETFDHRWFEVAPREGDRQMIEDACRALIDLMAARADRLVIDAISDFRRRMPEDVRRVEDELVDLGRSRNRKRDEMGIVVLPSEKAAWSNARIYAPWSIHLEIYGRPHGDVIAAVHDCGVSISFCGTEGEADVLTDQLKGVTSVRPHTGPARDRD